MRNREYDVRLAVLVGVLRVHDRRPYPLPLFNKVLLGEKLLVLDDEDELGLLGPQIGTLFRELSRLSLELEPRLEPCQAR